MQKLKNSLISCHANYRFPSPWKIEDVLNLHELDIYIPENVLFDLILLSSHLVFDGTTEGAVEGATDYQKSLAVLLTKLNTSIIDKSNSPLHIAVKVLKKMHQHGIDLRMVELARHENSDIAFCFVKNTFNYKFDIKNLSFETIEFLNITENQLRQIERLPDDIIDVLNFANEIGNSLYPGRIVTTVKYGNMKSYSDIAKAKKSKLIRPDFYAKYALKDIDVLYPEDKVVTGKRLIIGFSTNTKLNNNIHLINKLLGVLILNHKKFELKNEITVYIDLGSEIRKLDISDSLNFFRGSFQLSMFNRTNSEFLSHITFNEPNSTILFVPIPDQPCALSSTSLNGCRINMIIPARSKMKNRYQYMCSKTGGKVIMI